MNFDTFIGPDGKVCVKPTHNDSYNYEFFLKQLEKGGHLPRAMGIAVIDYLCTFLADAIGDGASVTIDGLGTFSPSLTIDKESERKELDGHSVALSKITFRPHPALKGRARQRMSFNQLRSSSKMPAAIPDLEKRKELLLELFKKKSLISSSDYKRATGISRSRAYTDLATFEAGGIIVTYYAGRNKMYALKQQ